MKKNTLKFWIVLFTFVIGIISTFLWFRLNPVIESFEDVDLSTIPNVAYCDLVNDPRKYDGKIIRLKYEKIHWFMHGYYLANENCAGEGDSERTAISFYEPNRDLLWKTLDQNLQRTNHKAIEVVMAGRFTYKNILGGSDAIEDRTHLQFEIYKIEFLTWH